MHRMATAALLAGFLFTIPSLTAADAPEAKTVMTERGSLLFSDDLTQPSGKEWTVAKGKWTASGGAVKGAERKDEKHAAVMRHSIKFHDAVVQFSFRLDGARSTSLSINDATGHVCRVSITPAGFSVRKDHHKKREEKPALLDEKKIPLKPGEWHTMVVEIHGKELAATLDGRVTAFGEHDGVNVEKAHVRLTVAGDSVSFKDLRVWAATPSKTWAATKAKLLAARKLPASK